MQEIKRKLAVVLTLFVLVFAAFPTVQASTITLTPLSGTAGAKSSEGYANLFDRNSGTKWCVTNFNGAYVMWKMSSAVSVTGYTICTANDNATYKGRNPYAWKLYGCNSSSTPSRNYSGWKCISTVTKGSSLKDVNYTTYSYVLKNTPAKYQYYKLEISKTAGAKIMQMAEFTLNYSGSTKFVSNGSPTPGTSSSSTSSSSSSSSQSSSSSTSRSTSTTCKHCGGKGKIECKTCGGTGYWSTTTTTPYYGGLGKSGGTKTTKKDCPYCVGGWRDCPYC